MLTILNAPHAAITEPNGVNNLGQIVGGLVDVTGSHGFVYANGVFSTIDVSTVPGETFATGINDLGQIVLSTFGSGGLFIDTNGEITDIEVPGISIVPAGINNAGEILININANVVIPPTPEPGALLLVSGGLAGISLVLHRKRSS